jgi:hypothetical protein
MALPDFFIAGAPKAGDSGGLLGPRPSGQRQARNGQPREFRAPPAA